MLISKKIAWPIWNKNNKFLYPNFSDNIWNKKFPKRTPKELIVPIIEFFNLLHSVPSSKSVSIEYL